MKAYKVTVNGNVYEITLEIVDKEEIEKSAPKESTTEKVQTNKGEGTSINSPMPGTILKVNVTNGANVKKGDVLMILEAMKMENEIMAPHDGVISSVNVQQGAAVETNALLCTLA